MPSVLSTGLIKPNYTTSYRGGMAEDGPAKAARFLLRNVFTKEDLAQVGIGGRSKGLDLLCP